MSMLMTVAAFIVALGVMIVVHEFGHYLAARWCNVKVLRFSVGFGRPIALWRRGADRTEWTIAAIPFGGYVKMLDERDGEVIPEEVHRAFNRQRLGRRALIVIAGPAFNLLFAVVVYAALFMTGLPELRPMLAAPASGSVAAAADVRRGDLIRRIDGREVLTWQDARLRMLQAALQGDRVTLEVDRLRGGSAGLLLDLKNFAGGVPEEDMLGRIGLKLSALPVLGSPEPNGVAERAGLRAGDRITHVEGKPVDDWGEFVRAIRARPGQPTRLVVERQDAE
ncbi:MAG: RIP metalloprotease RseP, partial [Betaproteobacteria bacterium]|nr:RIP metalloprotease RseP [Betaproteobacteria bacterium]